MRCWFKHTAQEIAYFYYYEDYNGDSDKQISLLSCDSCQETACLHFKECICNEMDHPHWIGNDYSDSDDPDEAQNPHGPAPGIDTSYYSSGDDTDPYMNKRYWAEGSWTDLCFNRDVWAISLEEGTYCNDTFETDDGKTHYVPNLQYIGNGYVQTADEFGETYYVELFNLCSSTYLDPRGYDSTTEERYRDCPAPSVLVR